jgi:endonuclease YncB( thermonuclease family)
MSSVTQFGRRRRGVPRFAGLALLVLVLCGLVLFQTWRSGHIVLPQAKPSPLLFAVRAVDGDTLSAQSQRIRLSGIDAPELSQTCRDARGRPWSCGTAAHGRLSALLAQGGVTCTRRGEDRYGRMLATCAAAGVADIGEAMVRAGYALNYSRYTSDYANAEREARAARRGLWQGDFDNPEDWRRRHARAE